MKNTTSPVFDHLMVDIETLGKASRAVILSIGAVAFNIASGQTGKSFYRNIDIQSCLNVGLSVEGSTIEWWLKQDKEAQLALLENPCSISSALQEFSAFVESCGGMSLQVWGNSARFDLGKLDDAYTALGLDLPWRYSNERDVRTLVAFAPELKKNQERKGIHHHGLDDCHHQIKYCSKIWSRLFN